MNEQRTCLKRYRRRVKAMDVKPRDVICATGRTVLRVERPDPQRVMITVQGRYNSYTVTRHAGRWTPVLREVVLPI